MRSQVTECVCTDSCRWTGGKPECFSINHFSTFIDESVDMVPATTLAATTTLEEMVTEVVTSEVLTMVTEEKEVEDAFTM